MDIYSASVLISILIYVAVLGDIEPVCSWEANHRMPGYQLLAGALSTTRVVFVVCTLSNDGSPRSPDSCSLQALGADQITRARQRWSVSGERTDPSKFG